MLRKRRRFSVNGSVSPGFEPVRELFQEGFRRGLETKAQLCVFADGECVVDLWGSSSIDPSHDDYGPETLQNVFSSTKSLTAIVFATLVDRGLLDYQDKVVTHWPEFGQAGKSDLRVCDVLRHEAGLVHLESTVLFDDLRPEMLAQNTVGAIIERQSPVHPPPTTGTRRQYHGVTRGWILNEIFRRVDPQGRTIGQYLRAKLGHESGFGGALIGLTESESSSPIVADVKGWSVAKVALESAVPIVGRVEPSVWELARLLKRLQAMRKDSTLNKSRPPMLEDMEKLTPKTFVPLFNRFSVRAGESPSGNGSCSARGLARIGNAVLNKDPRLFVNSNTVEKIHDDVVRARDYGLSMMATEFSQGGINFYRIHPEDSAHERSEKVLRDGFCGWMGFGGSVFQWHPELRVSFAYIPTRVSWFDPQNRRGARLQHSVVQCLESRRLDDIRVRN